MKKFILSSIVIVSFVAYSLYQRTFGEQSSTVHISSVTPTPTQNVSAVSSGSTTGLPTTTLPSQQKSEQSISTDTPTKVPTPTNTSVYKDGSYSGDPADAFYGNIQVQVTIANGKITNIQFLQAPNDRGRSIDINSQADPMLAQEAIQSQSAQVDIVSGATDSSQAFVQSMQSALAKAKS